MKCESIFYCSNLVVRKQRGDEYGERNKFLLPLKEGNGICDSSCGFYFYSFFKNRIV